MAEQHKNTTSKAQSRPNPESGTPGGGTGRKDETGKTNVYPMSGAELPPSGEARLQPMGTFGQADRGPEGYYDSGNSEIIPDERFHEEKKKSSEKEKPAR